MKVYILLVCTLLSGTNAYAYTESIYIHSKKYGLDPALVKTIATLESGLNPLAINVAGKAYFPKSKHAAASIIQQAWATEKSFDVGLMQINSWIGNTFSDSFSSKQLLVFHGCFVPQ